MDTFCTIIRRLIVAFFLAASSCFSLLAAAANLPQAGLYSTQAKAYAACQSTYTSYSTNSSVTIESACLVQNDPNSGYDAYLFSANYPAAGGQIGGYYDFLGGPENPCSTLTSFTSDFPFGAGQLKQLPATVNMPVSDPITGATVQCGENVTYGQPTAVADQYGHFHVMMTVTPTGNPSGGGASSATQATFVGVSGSAVTTADGSTPSPSAPDPAVQACGAGSCYNEGTGTFSVVDSASGSTASVSANAAVSGGGCGSAGGSTVCAGSPSAPSPVGTAGTEITSPTTEQSSQTIYQTANVSTGSLGTVQVATYTAPGTTTSSGSTSSSKTAASVGSLTNSGSSSPASSSSSGDSDSDSPSGNCGTPPQCSGDSVMCGIQIQEWDAMCVQQNYMVGNGQQPPTFSGDQTAYTQSQLWVQPSSSLQNTEGGQANQGTYNTAGFGYSTSCPMQDFTFSTVAVTIPFASKGCEPLSYFRALAIGFALFAAAKITAGGTG